MSLTNIKIIPYSLAHQHSVDQLMQSIQQEFSNCIIDSDSRKIADLSLNKNEWYWVAMTDDQVVGTAGLMDLENDVVVLKWMALAKEYRGKEKGIAIALLNTVIRAARQQNNSAIYLSITEQLDGARIFYVRNGFKEIAREDLPPDFVISPSDSLFFKRQL